MGVDFTPSGFRRSCPWRDHARDARCILLAGHGGPHEVAGSEDLLAKEADRHDRIVYVFDGPSSDR